MPFVDTNSRLTTKPRNFDIKCQSNSESYDRHSFYGTKFRGGPIFFLLFTEGSFFNERDYSGADCLDLLVMHKKTIGKKLDTMFIMIGLTKIKTEKSI